MTQEVHHRPCLVLERDALGPFVPVAGANRYGAGLDEDRDPGYTRRVGQRAVRGTSYEHPLQA